MIKSLTARLLAGLMVLACIAPAAVAAWPEREITLTLPYGAGGNTDLVARALARNLEEKLGKPVVVLNKPGALGTIGPGYVKEQMPDGYNIGIVTGSTAALAPHLVPVRFSLDDFEYIAGFAAVRLGLAVRADSPYKTMDDLVQAAKARQVFFGSATALNVLLLSDLNRQTGSKFDVAQYKSGSEITTALLGGHVEAIVQNPSDIIPQVKSGKLRMLASVSPLRWPEMRDTPTLKELGYDTSASESWIGIVAPKGTPRDIVAKLESAMLQITKQKDFQTVMDANGVDTIHAPGQEFYAFLKKRHIDWGEGLKRANLLPAK